MCLFSIPLLFGCKQKKRVVCNKAPSMLVCIQKENYEKITLFMGKISDILNEGNTEELIKNINFPFKEENQLIYTEQFKISSLPILQEHKDIFKPEIDLTNCDIQHNFVNFHDDSEENLIKNESCYYFEIIKNCSVEEYQVTVSIINTHEGYKINALSLAG